MNEKRGVALEIDGEEIWFTPFRAGPRDRDKRASWVTLVQASEAHYAAAADGADQLAETYEAVCVALVEFAYHMLVDNYGAERARQIAESVSPYHASALVSIAREGRLPVDFTTAGETEDG